MDALKRVEPDLPVPHLYREVGISTATFEGKSYSLKEAAARLAVQAEGS